jgi:phosphatidate phosphatase APP1
MTQWENLSRLLRDVSTQYETLNDTVRQWLGFGNALQILPYYGYGSTDRLYFRGRVMRDGSIRMASLDAPVWENLLNMYKRFGAEVIPNAKIQATFLGQQKILFTDDRGYFEAEFHLNESVTDDRQWQDVELQLLSPTQPEQPAVEATARILIPSANAKFGVISDIDDTVVYTYSNDLLRMVQIVYLGNAYTRIPFPGISRFYQALHQGGSGQESNPFFYVSNSTWNLYDLLMQFLEIHELPTGPLLLSDFEFSLDQILTFTHEQYKLKHLRPIFECYPNLAFILIGDSSQRDAEIYSQLVQDYPNQVLAIYIRNVSPDDWERRQRLNAIAQIVQQAGVPFVIVPDTLTAATHAARSGWISAEALPAIKADKRKEQAQSEPLV